MLRATGSVLTNKYSEGYPGKRYYGGNEVIDEVEDLARERAKALFGAEHANVQPHSGANANMAVYLALLEPGDTVLGLRLDQGGHLTHGSPVNASGRLYHFVSYGVTPSDERIDFDQVRDLALRAPAQADRRRRHRLPPHHRPRSRSARSPTRSGALFMFDAAHIAGLIAGGAHPSPVPYADIVTFTTHKTLRGPRGGSILGQAELAETHRQGGVPRPAGRAARPRHRGQGGGLPRGGPARVHRLRPPDRAPTPPPWPRAWPAHGLRLVSGGTDNHLMLVDLRSFDADLSGKKARLALDRAGHQPQREHRARRPPPAVHHQRPAHRHAGGHHPGHAGAGDGDDRRAHPPDAAWAASDEAELAAVRDEVVALCSKFAPYPA